jgi:hypothetical protein
MNLRLSARAGAAAALTSAFVLAVTGPGLAPQAVAPAGQDRTGAPAEARKATNAGERASGVVVKVERFPGVAPNGPAPGRQAQPGRPSPATVRLTINTNAVWSDWVRDQSQITDKGPPAKDAAKGANSVATRGEPADKNSLVVVDVGPMVKVETRFRSPDDETTPGKKAAETARPGEPRRSDRTQSAKPVEFRADDLKPGLWVEVDFRHVAAQNHASAVRVVRPLGGPSTPAEQERPR